MGRPPRTLLGMTISVVLRLVQERLREGELVGRLQMVETGEERVVTSVADLLAFLRGWGVAIEPDPAASPDG